MKKINRKCIQIIVDRTVFKLIPRNYKKKIKVQIQIQNEHF